MKKNLIALAVAAAVAAPAAVQADVTIYGKIHMSLDYYWDALADPTPSVGGDDDDDGDLFDDDSGLGVSSNSSRIGFKGSEDLGSGLTAIWQVESDVRLDELGGDWASRNSFIGLSSGFGTVLAGKHDTPMKDLGRKLDIFGDTIGDSRALTRMSAGGAGWDERLDNAIAYVSPDFAGLKFVAAYSADWAADDGPRADNNDFDAWSASLTYQHSMFFIGAAYEMHNATIDILDAGVVVDENDEDESAWRVGGGLSIAGFKFGGMWQTSDSDITAFRDDRDVWGLFASYKFGNTTLGGQWYTVDEIDGIDDSDADLWGVGLFHNLSKRTQIYGLYSQIDNSDNGVAVLGGGGGHGDVYAPAEPGEDPSSFSVGVIHSF